jgi:hypothetical protein
MDNLTPLWSGVFALAGIAVGAILSYILTRRQRKREWKREALQQQLNELYRPLYEKMIIMPGTDPTHYFADWEEEEFRKWLAEALQIIIPKLHLLPDEILGKIHGWRETLVLGQDSGISTEPIVEFLYDHIDKYFHFLRKELGIS